MAGPLERLQAYRKTGVVIDSNLLLLFFLGSYERKQISSNKRLAVFTVEDFDLLTRFLSQFSRLITTPNILTEVSNLSNAIPDSKKGAYFGWFASKLAVLQEEYVSSSAALMNRWAKFGLTDAGIAEIAKNQYLVLTDDFPLSQSLQNAGIDAVNFNHLRDAYWRRGN
jgi:rRNA-processing protein FCF1